MFDRLLGFYRQYGHQAPLAFKAILDLRCRVVLVSGRLRRSGVQVRLIYAGRGRNLPWLLQHVFEDWQQLQAVRCTPFNFRGALQRLGGDADVEVIDIGWPYDTFARDGARHVELPPWINMTLHLPDTWEEVRRCFRPTTRNNDLRIIRREGYTCEPTRDPALIDDFHEHMYVPSMRGRHGDGAIIVPLARMQKRARDGWLLRILKDGEVVAAGLVHPAGDTCYFLWMGVPAGRPMAEGATSALYYFGIRHAFDQGYRMLDFGTSRPALNDGPLRFKRKWGGVLADTVDPGALLIAPRAGRMAGLRFCASLPMLVRGSRGLEALFASEEPADAARLTAAWREFGCAGIRRATLVTTGAQFATELLPPDSSGCEYRLVSVPPDEFSRHFPEQPNLVNATARSNVPATGAGELIDWPAGQKLPDIVGCRHHLMDTGLFCDEGLLEVFDRHNPAELLVYRMGEDHHNLDDFQQGSRGKLTSRELLDAVKAGRLWLNIIHVQQLPAFRALIDRIYDELESKVEGFSTVVRSANLLVSSPGAKVYYHADAPLNMLWHLRGEKRIWIYPDGEKYAPREWVEMLFTRESDDDLPYRPEFDQDATPYPLRPGEMLTWPQNRPHRVENVEGFCVSLTTEHYTPEAMKKRLTYLSNRYLRQWMGLPTTGVGLDGPVAAAKRTLFRVARHMPWWREAAGDGKASKFSLDR